jgi:hypothetical protein
LKKTHHRFLAIALPVLLTSTTLTATAAEKPASTAKKGAVPAELVGNWRWTTISGTNYVDRSTGQITDNAGGMSTGFTFGKDGRYKFNFYIKQRTYGLLTESYTTEEGTVTFQPGTFTVQPTKGHYRGSSTGGRKVDRPMTKSEMKKKVYLWRWQTKDGQRQLMMGPSEQSLSHFKKEK